MLVNQALGKKEDQQFKAYPKLHKKFKASLGNMKPCHNNRKRKEKRERGGEGKRERRIRKEVRVEVENTARLNLNSSGMRPVVVCLLCLPMPQFSH